MTMRILQGWMNLLFPPKCVFCRKILAGGGNLCCQDCMEKLENQEYVSEGMFGKPCWTALYYEGAVRDAVARFKFRGSRGYAMEFGEILGRCIQRHLTGEYDLITWVPVSEKRCRQRGYDQAMLLAQATALYLGDVAVETLKKPVDNPTQSSLRSVAERKSNVLGAYCATEPELTAGKRILLIDDVITTGATMEEASRTLLDAGAKTVLGAALARPREYTKDSCEVSL